MASPGSLLEYYHSKRLMCALCLRSDNKDNLFVRTEENREDKVHRSKVIFHSPASVSVQHAPEEIARYLKGAAQKRDEAAAAVEIEQLWELLVDDGSALELNELAELYYSAQPQAEQLSGLYRALDQDKTWFIRKNTSYLPRSRAQVEETRARLRAEADKAQEREQAAAWLKELWHRGRPPQGENPGGSRYLRWIREVAVLGNEAPRFKEIQALFKELEISGRDAAFRVMIKAGLWNEDEFITLHRLRPPDEFSPALQAEAQQAALAPPTGERQDLTELDCFTIDDIDTSEIDDALSLEKTEQGYRLGIHIADVASRLPIGSELDKEARERGTCIYLPERKLRMLPEVLGDQACSLVAGEERPAFTFLVEVDQDANILSTRMVRSRIRVRERLTYEEVDADIERFSWKPLLAISEKLRDQRSQQGAFTLPFGRITIKVARGEGEPVIQLLPEDPHSVAQLIVSEMMILANRIAGEYCLAHSIPAIFRSQPAPEQALPKEGLTPEVMFKMRRFLRKGEVGLKAERHHGLGVDAYTQATSPIRRYSDLVAQRQLAAHLAGEPLPYSLDEVESILHDVGRTASQAEQLERERKLYWTLRFFEQRRFEEFEAIVLANFPDKHIVQLQPVLFETDCPHVPGKPLPPGSRIRVRIDAAYPRQESLRVSPQLDHDEDA